MGRPRNTERRAQIKEYRKKGFKIGEIARLLMVDRQVVEYYIKTYPQDYLQNKKQAI